MKRKIISVLLALILCFSLAVSVSAEPKAVDFVVDEIGYLAGSEVDELNDLAVNLYKSCGVGIFFVFTELEILEDYDIAPLLNGITDYVIMLENDFFLCILNCNRYMVLNSEVLCIAFRAPQ